jgi:hypothetical protein
VLRELTGAAESPFLSVRLEEAVEVLVHLVWHPEECLALGEAARTWMETYWRDDLLASHYTHVYNRLSQGPEQVKRQRALQINTPDTQFKALTMPDLLFEGRRRNQCKID